MLHIITLIVAVFLVMVLVVVLSLLLVVLLLVIPVGIMALLYHLDFILSSSWWYFEPWFFLWSVFCSCALFVFWDLLALWRCSFLISSYYAQRGGHSNGGSICGVFYVYGNFGAAYYSWYFGAALL